MAATKAACWKKVKRDARTLTLRANALQWSFSRTNYKPEQLGIDLPFTELDSEVLWTVMIFDHLYRQECTPESVSTVKVASTAAVTFNLHIKSFTDANYLKWRKELDYVLPDYNDSRRLPYMMSHVHDLIRSQDRAHHKTVKRMWDDNHIMRTSQTLQMKSEFQLLSQNVIQAVNIKVGIQTKKAKADNSDLWHVLSVVVKRSLKGTEMYTSAFVIDAGRALSLKSGEDGYDTHNTQVSFVMGLVELENALNDAEIMVNEWNFTNSYIWTDVPKMCRLSTQLIAAAVAYEWQCLDRMVGMHPIDEIEKVFVSLNAFTMDCLQHNLTRPSNKSSKGRVLAIDIRKCCEKIAENESPYLVVLNMFNHPSEEPSIAQARTSRAGVRVSGTLKALKMQNAATRENQMSSASEFRDSVIDSNCLMATLEHSQTFESMLKLMKAMNARIFCRTYKDPNLCYLDCDNFMYWALITYETQYLRRMNPTSTLYPSFAACPETELRSVFQKPFLAYDEWMTENERRGMPTTFGINRLEWLFDKLGVILEQKIWDPAFPFEEQAFTYLYKSRNAVIKPEWMVAYIPELQQLSLLELDSVIIPLSVCVEKIRCHATTLVLKREDPNFADVTGYVIDTSSLLCEDDPLYDTHKNHTLFLIALYQLMKLCRDHNVPVTGIDFTNSCKWGQSQNTCNLAAHVVSTAVVFGWPMEGPTPRHYSDDHILEIYDHLVTIVDECILVNNAVVRRSDFRSLRLGNVYKYPVGKERELLIHIITCVDNSMKLRNGLLPLVRHTFVSPNKYAPDRLDRDYLDIHGELPIKGEWARKRRKIMKEIRPRKLAETRLLQSRKRSSDRETIIDSSYVYLPTIDRAQYPGEHDRLETNKNERERQEKEMEFRQAKNSILMARNEAAHEAKRLRQLAAGT